MRDELVSAAIRLFGEHGFSGTSTRRLASEAGTTMSNITYHFGGKDGLYQAAGEAILDRMNSAISERPIAPLAPDADTRDAMALVAQVVRNMGEFMLRDDVAPMARFVAREHNDPKSEFGKQLRAEVHHLGSRMAAAIAILRPDLSEPQCRDRAFFIYAMITGIRNGRAPLCAITEVASVDEQRGRDLLAELELCVRDMLHVS